MSKSASRSHTVSNQHESSTYDRQQHQHDSESEDGSESDDYAPHRDPKRLEPVYERFGTLYETANYFGVSSPTIRKHLKRHDLYTPESNAETEEGRISSYDLENMNPEDVGLPPIGER